MSEDRAPVSPAAPTTPIRARELGIPLDGEPGTWNAITDVPGVEVGYATLMMDDPEVIRTGVTMILPRGRSGLGLPCAAGVSVLNGNGEMTGRNWIEEAGQFQTPVAITNSHAVGAVHQGIDRWLAVHDPVAASQWMMPVVGETWDGYLNSINAGAVGPEHAIAALDAAASGPVAEGNVGGGTGMNCYGFKGGTGTASRIVRAGERSWTLGVILQANFGSRHELRVVGRPLGRESAVPCPIEASRWFLQDAKAAGSSGGANSSNVAGAGSVIAVIATDAPLLPEQCRALAQRVPLGLARTGTTGSHFSGDIFLAFSTANAGGLTSRLEVAPGTIETFEHLSWGAIDPFFAAVVESVEEAVLNVLVAARDMVGRDGHASYALPHEEIRAAFPVAESDSGAGSYAGSDAGSGPAG